MQNCKVCGTNRDEQYMLFREEFYFCDSDCYSGFYQTSRIDNSLYMFTESLNGFSETLNGFTGKSAYQYWIDLGNTGSEADFILSIKGDRGDQGLQGNNGTDGLQGIQGERGLQGLPGIKGDTGATGSNGYTPVKGVDYFDGVKGDTGSQGLQGLQGIPGVKGDTGTSGYTPVKGVDYFDGSQGVKGDKGDQGDQGIQGVTGQTGYTPIKGVDYFDGAQGVKGDTGSQGVQGVKGDGGDQGIQGIQGLQGPAGSGIGYAINIQALTSSPTDSQTVYFGVLPKVPTTTANTSKIYIRKACTLKVAEIYCYSGTAGTAEAWSLYIRKNNTTDTLIKTLTVNTNERVFTNDALSISLVAGDYVEIKGVQPLWATNPLTCIYAGYLYFE